LDQSELASGERNGPVPILAHVAARNGAWGETATLKPVSECHSQLLDAIPVALGVGREQIIPGYLRIHGSPPLLFFVTLVGQKRNKILHAAVGKCIGFDDIRICASHTCDEHCGIVGIDDHKLTTARAANAIAGVYAHSKVSFCQ